MPVASNTPAKLIEHSVSHHEAYLTSTGSLSVSTGAFTGRSPENRYIVDTGDAERNINWNSSTNKPIDEKTYKRVRKNVTRYMSQRRHLFVIRGYAGADRQYARKVMVVCERAHQALFIQNMLVRPTADELEVFGRPDILVFAAPSYVCSRDRDGVEPAGFSAAVRIDLPRVRSRVASRVDRDDDALAAEARGGGGDQIRVGDRRRVERNLVRSRVEHRADVFERAQSAADGQRHENLVGGAFDDVAHDGAPVRGSGDVEKDELVRALLFVGARAVDGIARVAERLELHAFDDAPGFDVKTRNDANGKHGHKKNGKRSLAAQAVFWQNQKATAGTRRPRGGVLLLQKAAGMLRCAQRQRTKKRRTHAIEKRKPCP